MIFSIGHGDKLQWLAGSALAGRLEANQFRAQAEELEPDVVPARAALPDFQAGPPELLSFAAVAAETQSVSREMFGYFFPEAAQVRPGDRKSALEALAAAMIEQGDDPAGGDADIAPVMTYFGQFIDHDITAGTNTDDVTVALRIGGPTIEPQNRSLVSGGLANLRRGALDLDSLYGDGPITGPMTDKLMRAMRDSTDPNKMRLGELDRLEGDAVPVLRAAGKDNQLDLLRVGDVVGTGQVFSTSDELPELLRPKSDQDVRWDRAALIGDARNDENLIIAQTHVAMLKLHNSFVDRGMQFHLARQMTAWHYQWLIVNSYLPAICDAPTLQAVINSSAPLYARFYAARKGNLPTHSYPLPIEFSTAAFRFGHSMVRAIYDYNINFNNDGDQENRCTFELLFEFTGKDPSPIGRFGNKRLPDNWPIDWVRFTNPQARPTRRARNIDTRLTPPLFNMVNEHEDATHSFRRLAERNLKRGHVQNLPSAQALIAKLTEIGLKPHTVLTPAEIASGATGAAIEAGGFKDETPLWFYVLKEAELKGRRGRLGPLGTRIVAETLVGLIVQDERTYWNRPGGAWSPDEAADAQHPAINDFSSLFRAAGVLA